MSSGWSIWVIFLIVLNLGITLWLFFWAPRVKIPTLPDGTSGHVWAHGVLREGIRALPMWWIIFSACMFIGGIGYLVLYGGFGDHEGVLGWSSQAEQHQDLTAKQAKFVPVLERARSQPLTQLVADAEAMRAGHFLFQENCAGCHGTDARGNHVIGAPNLTDTDWVYGGEPDTILASILDGRTGAMPPLGTMLGNDGVNEAAAYVLSFSGVKSPEGWAERGKARYEAICIACHGADGRGNPTLGAPNLTDHVWLYGDAFSDIAATIRDGRNGVMPAWRTRLGDDRARLVAAWVISQGSPSPAQTGSP